MEMANADGREAKSYGKEGFGVCVCSSPDSGAGATSSDLEVMMVVRKRLSRSMFCCRNTSTMLKVRPTTELSS